MGFKNLLIFLLFFTAGCLLNPHDLEDFDNYYFETVDLTDNLVFYHFNESEYTGATGEVIDASGLGKNSTTVGAPTKDQGIYGDGINCTGSNGVDLTPTEFDSAFSGRTISVWFRARTTSGLQYIFEEGGTVNGINIYIEDGTLYGGAYKGSGGDFNIFLPYSIEADRWYNVVTLFDSDTDTFYMYIDGVIVSTGSLLGHTFPAHSNPNGVCFQNDDSRRHDGGSNGSGGPENYFNGVVDELAVWNRALSHAEILNLYNRQGRI